MWFSKCLLPFFVNAESRFCFDPNCKPLLNCIFKASTLVLYLPDAVHVLCCKIGRFLRLTFNCLFVLLLSSCGNNGDLYLYRRFKTLKFVQVLSHIIKLFHRARISAFVLSDWVSHSCTLAFHGRLSHNTASGSCSSYDAGGFPSALIKFLLKRFNFSFSLSYLFLSHSYLCCNRLVQWLLRFRFLWFGFKSERRSGRGCLHDNVGGSFLAELVRFVRWVLLVFFLKNIILSIRSNESVAAKKLLCVELILSLQNSNPRVAELCLLLRCEVACNLAFGEFVLLGGS